MVPKAWWWILGIVFAGVIAVAAVFVIIPSSGDDDAQAVAVDTDVRDPGSWTFMVYMIGDTDLEPYALDDIAEMASVGSTDDANIVALVDRSPDYTTDPAVDLADWEDTVSFLVEKDHLQVVDELGERNMGDPATLADFVADTAAQFPADNYGLVLWDHGGGWIGMGPDETDDYDILSVPEIGQGIADGLERAGIDKLDLLGFDACLMATYEVASVMADHADYMVASQEVEPGHGWNYEELAVIADNPQATAPELGEAMVEGFALQADEEGTSVDITLGLFDLSQIGAVQEAVTQLADVYEADPDGLGPEFATAQSGVLEFGRNPDPEQATNQIDLGSYADSLAGKGGPEIDAAADAVTEALEAIVMTETAGPAMAGASGLSIYFPETEAYFSADYMDLAGLVPAWPGALAAFYDSGSRLAEDVRAQFESGDGATSVSFGDDGVTFTAYLPPSSAAAVIDSTVSAGYRDGDDIVYVAEMPAPLTISDNEASVTAQYDLTYLTLTDGEDTMDVYQDITDDPDTGYRTIDVPLEYVAPDDDAVQDALLSIVVDEEGTIVGEDFYILDDTGMYGAMSPDPDARIYPVALVLVDDEQWEYQRIDDEGIAADLPAIQYVFETLESGTTLMLDADVQDYGQEADTASVEVAIP